MSAEDFLVELGAELRRTPEQMQPIIDKIVHENWFIRLPSSFSALLAADTKI